MNLERLKIKDFRGIRVADMDFRSSTVHMVSAPNRTGKTSLRAAIQYCYTGLALGLKHKKDAAIFARKGSKKCRVGVTSDGIEVTRTPAKCSLGAADLARAYGSSDMLAAVFDVHRFLRLSPPERSKLVRLVAGDVDAIREEVKRTCFEAGLDSAAELFGQAAVDNLDLAEKLAREERAKCTREAKELGDSDPERYYTATLPGGVSRRFDLEGVSPDQQRAKMTAVQGERDAALEARGAAKLDPEPEGLRAKIEELDVKLKGVKRPTDAAVAKLAAVERQARARTEEARRDLASRDGALRAIAVAGPDDADTLEGQLEGGAVDDKARALKVAELTAAERESKQALDAAKHTVAVCEGSMLALGSAKDVAKLGGECPTCEQKITKAHVARIKKDRKARAKVLTNELAAAKRAVDKADMVHSEALAKLECAQSEEDARGKLWGKLVILKAMRDARTAIQDGDKVLGDAVAKLDYAKLSIEEHANLTTERARLVDELKSAANYDELCARLEELETRIALGEKIIAAVDAYHDARAAGKRKAELEHKREAWDLVAKALGPGGRVREIASDGFSIEDVQAAADIMLDGSRVEVADDWTITLDGVQAEGEVLSGSERFLLGAAFAGALAKASGLGVLVLDEADVCVGATKTAFFKWLASIAGDFNRVLVLASSPREPAPSGVDWLTVWHIENGTVRAM